MEKVSHLKVLIIAVTVVVIAIIGITYLVLQKAESSSKQVNSDSNLSSELPSTLTEQPTKKPTKTKKPGKILKKQSYVNEETGEFNPFNDYLDYIERTKTIWNDKLRPEVPIYPKEELFDAGDEILFNLDAGADSKKSVDLYSRFGRAFIVLKSLPTTAIGEGKDKSYVYLMYDTEMGIRLFLFYSKEKHNYQVMDGFAVKMSTKRSYADYRHLRPGDLYEEVVKLEPAVSPQFEDMWNRFADSDIKHQISNGDGPTTIHILTDGVLKIDYKRNADNKYEITNLIYAEDYVLDGLDGKTCYQIHPDDFVEE